MDTDKYLSLGKALSEGILKGIQNKDFTPQAIYVSYGEA
jgi:hypothetical protein